MALEDWWKLSDRELVKLRQDLGSTHSDAPAVDQIIRLRIAAREVEGSAALIRVTNRLGVATWVLGVVTFLLVIAAGIQAYPIFKREEEVGHRIRRECEAIMREAAAVAPHREITDQVFKDAVFTCVVSSATKGRP